MIRWLQILHLQIVSVEPSAPFKADILLLSRPEAEVEVHTIPLKLVMERGAVYQIGLLKIAFWRTKLQSDLNFIHLPRHV